MDSQDDDEGNDDDDDSQDPLNYVRSPEDKVPFGKTARPECGKTFSRPESISLTETGTHETHETSIIKEPMSLAVGYWHRHHYGTVE